MKEEIKFMFQNVNESLRFAEGKHAALIVLNSGVIFGVLTIYKDYQYCLPKAALLFSVLSFICSIMFSVFSLFPRNYDSLREQKTFENPNLFFAGHLSKLDVKGLKAELNEIHPAYIFDKFDESLLNSIIANAAIATIKYRLFKYAITSTVIGLVAPLAMVIFKVMWCN